MDVVFGLQVDGHITGGGGGGGASKQQFTVTYRNGLQRSSAAFSTKLIYSVITVNVMIVI